jgi:mRNA-degrading endonuclease RelE of RelBE toxin-antitoxin system
MNKYKVRIDTEAITDINGITSWYNDRQSGLGGRFQKTVVRQINALKKNPQIYAIRYKDIRCISLKKFPYMVHFFINEDTKTVEVLAIISTDRNPKIWTVKTGK